MAKKTLSLSLVIPVYNEQRYLKACLDSIARQTISAQQVIVVDNNSTDRSVEIASRYKFVKVVSEKRQGIVYARNAGFDAAKCDLIGRIDADTILPEDWVEKAKQAYANSKLPKLYASTSPSSFRNRGGSYIFYALHRLTYFWPARLMLGHNTLVGSNMLISHDLWDMVKKSTCINTNIHEDMDLAFHIGKTGTAIIFQPDLKASVVARKMFSRTFSYPFMMLRVKFTKHDCLRTSY